MKKYELTNETKTIGNLTLHRIYLVVLESMVMLWYLVMLGSMVMRRSLVVLISITRLIIPRLKDSVATSEQLHSLDVKTN